MSNLEKTQDSNQYDTTNCAPERLVFKLYNRGWPNANYLPISQASTNIPANGTLVANVLGSIIPGTGDPGTRTGKNIQVRHFMLNISASAPAASTVSVEWRMIIFMAQTPYTVAAPPTFNPAVCLTFTPNAMYNPINCDKNVIIYDSGYQIASAEEQNRGWTRQISIPLNKMTTYQSDTGTADSVATNNIWIIFANFDSALLFAVKSNGLVFYET